MATNNRNNGISWKVGGNITKFSEIIVMKMLEFIQREGGHPKS
jgi:hypothetical protein